MRGRFAPSPSGEMHLGNTWTALLAWLQVRGNGGRMVLRIEDLDPERSKQEYIDLLFQDLKWLGLDWDEGPDTGGNYAPYSQSERREIYEQAVGKLAKRGLLYPCYCTRAEIRGMANAPNGAEQGLEYPGACRSLTEAEQQAKEQAGREPAWRVKVPDREISFEDLCQGPMQQNLLRKVGDFAVTRADGIHAYQLAVVVDDGLMQISHVLRGDDLLLSTPRQLWLLEELGLPAPTYAHVPLLFGWDGQRLSKRHGSTSIAVLRRNGVRAEQIIGYLGFLAGFLGKPEPISARELIVEFDLGKLPKQQVIIPENLSLETLYGTRSR